VTEPATTWLPNLVGGVSIWKLARDLNEPHLFDGRLLVPDAEGPDSLPTRVTWNLGGLVPLPEARTSSPADVATAISDFLARLAKVGLELEDPASGFHRFSDAFTVPGLEADAGAHYFFDPNTKKLCVINWGASPRAIAGAQSLVFGWQSFDRVGGAAAGAPAAATGVVASGNTSPAAGPQAEAAANRPQEPNKDEKNGKKEKKTAAPVLLWGRPWWHWALVALVAAALVALALYLLRACNEPGGSGLADAGATPDSEASSAADGAYADGAKPGGEAGPSDAAGDAATDAPGDGSADGAADGPAEGAADASNDGKADGAADAKSDSRADGAPGAGAGNGLGGPGAGVGVGVGPGGTVIPGPSSLPHRFHFEPGAVRWRVTAGLNMLDTSSAVEGIGQNFEVILKPGGSFDGVKVQWQDANGRWHQ
jgi:hypothetical protein